MIEREVNHTKGGNSTDLSLSGHAESEKDSSLASSLFLEICDTDDLAPESRPSVAQEIDGLNKVGSIWISIARLGVANLEGEGRIDTLLFATDMNHPFCNLLTRTH